MSPTHFQDHAEFTKDIKKELDSTLLELLANGCQIVSADVRLLSYSTQKELTVEYASSEDFDKISHFITNNYGHMEVDYTYFDEDGSDCSYGRFELSMSTKQEYEKEQKMRLMVAKFNHNKLVNSFRELRMA